MYVDAAWSNGNSTQGEVIWWSQWSKWWNWWWGYDWTYYAQQNGYLPSDEWWAQWSQWAQWNETIDWWTLDEVVVTPENNKNSTENKCNWIKLNTKFPVVWNCITISEWNTNPINVFPGMMRGLTRIVMSIILVVCFIMIIIAGIMWAWAWEDSSQKTKAKEIIKKVAITVLLLWFSGAILRLINPNFFG
jgi:hypothetical protein